MEKIKNFLKPGHATDDEMLYGSPSSSRPRRSSQKGDKNAGSLRQSMPPVGDKHEETFSSPISEDTSTAASNKENVLLSEQRGQQDTTSGAEFNDTGYGTTGSAAAGARGEAPTTTAGPSAVDSFLKSSKPDDSVSTASVRSGVVGRGFDNPPSTLPKSTTASAEISDQSPTSNQNKHYGRDAAITGGAAAMGAKAYEGRRPDQPSSATAEDTYPREHHEGYAHVQPTSTARKFSLGGSKRPENLSTSTEPAPPSPRHHYGRDAAATGATGAAAYGVYERNKRDDRVDSAITSSPTPPNSSSTQPNPSAVVAAKVASSEQPNPAIESAPQQQYGRDAALAGADAAVAGGAYEHGHGRDDSAMEAAAAAARADNPRAVQSNNPLSQKQDNEQLDSNRYVAPGTTGASRGVASTAANPNPGNAMSNRDMETAEAAAATAMGVGAYGAGKHHSEEQSEIKGSQAATQNMEPRAAGSGAPVLQKNEGFESYPDRGPLSDALDPRVDTMPGTFPETPYEEKEEPQVEPQRSYDKDAIMAGGAGATGFGAYEAAKHHEPEGPTTETKDYAVPTQEPQAIGSAITTDERTPAPSKPHQGTEMPTGAASGPPEEHHYGRDAALTAGTGAAGVGAYKALKKDEPSDTPTAARDVYPEEAMKSHHHQPTSAATAGGLRPDSTTGDVDQSAQQDQHHYGRDATLAGGAGAAGAGAYEAGKHFEEKEEAPATAAKDIYPQELKEPHHHQPTSAATAGGLRPDSDTGDIKQEPEHHYGRDAALAGGTAAAGAGVYEAAKHHDQQEQPAAASTKDIYPEEVTKPHHHQPTSAATAGGVQPDSGTGKFPAEEPQHHYGRDAAVAGGAGAAGAGAYEAAKHYEKQPEQPASPTRLADIYPEELTQPHHHEPTTAATAGGIHPDAATGEGDLQRSDTGYRSQYKEHFDESDDKLAEAGTGAVVGGAGVGTAAYDYAQDHQPTAAQRDPADAIASAVTRGYDNQRAEPHATSSAAFDPVRGGTLSEGGVSVPHKHTHPEYHYEEQYPEQPEQHHYGRDAAAVGAVGVAGYGAHEMYERDTHGHQDPQSQYSSYDAAGAGPAGGDAYGAYGAHDTQYDNQYQQEPEVQHYGRDAAAPGAGPASGDAYGAHDTQQYDNQYQQDPQSHHYGRDAAAAGAVGGAAYGAHEIHQRDTPSSPVSPVARETSKSSSQYSGDRHHHDREGSGSPTSDRKRKHKILTFLNKDKDRQDRPTSMGSEQFTTPEKKEAYVADPAAEHLQEKEMREKLINPAGGPESAELQEFSGDGLGQADTRRSMEPEATVGTTGVLSQVGDRGGSLRSKTGTMGRNRLHKDPPPGWGSPGGNSETSGY